MTPGNSSVIAQETSPGQSQPALWEYVPINEYRIPSTTIQSSFKTRFMSFRDRLRAGNPKAAEPFERADDLKSLPDRLLKQILPVADWPSHLQAIDDAVAPWYATGNQPAPAIFVINIPYSHTEDLLTAWAESKGFRLIAPPAPGDISTDADAWLDRLSATDAIWVLPHLEKCYLRHSSGLLLVRKLFARLFSGRLGRGVIGCDSWAWAYLSRIFKLTSPCIRISQAFDSDRLAHWFYGSLPENRRQRFIFRQADTGRYVIKPESIQNAASGTATEPGPFLKDLAAYSRGIPGVALSLWRRCLKGQPDTIEAQQEENADSPQRLAIWVQSLTGMEKPLLPKGAGRSHTFVLHSLLLHNGLTDGELAGVFSLPAEEVTQVCFELELSGLILANDGVWRVSPEGYPVVRELLKTEGFLTDDF